MQVGKDIA